MSFPQLSLKISAVLIIMAIIVAILGPNQFTLEPVANHKQGLVLTLLVLALLGISLAEWMQPGVSCLLQR